MILLQDLVKQLATFHELHDEAPEPLVFIDIVELDDVWVVNLLQDVDFHLHRDLVLLRHLFLGKYLDRESLACFSMFGLLDSCEATLSEGGLNLVSLLDVSIAGFHVSFILKINLIFKRYYYKLVY